MGQLLLSAHICSHRLLRRLRVVHHRTRVDTLEVPRRLILEETMNMRVSKRFRIGDHVTWNSEAGRVSGTMVSIHTSNFDYKGYMHRASQNDPQYQMKSEKAQHVAAHKNGALEYA
jgi:hypothetical protein